jgi:tryptophan synthase alpha chain
MNNRIIELFKVKKEKVLNMYFTAGFPNLDDTVAILKELESAGADIIEIGMPYSDPLADGPTIQASGEKALANGMSIKKLFEQLEGIRNEVSIPIILMGYINPVMQYGVEAFCKKAGEIGIDGLILPDLHYREYEELYKNSFEENNLSNIFLVTPQTSEERLKKIDSLSSGFIYVVSSNSTTGNETKVLDDTTSYFERIKASELNNPTLIGFNIKDKTTFENASKYANGAIIGSAFIRKIENSKDLKKDIHEFVKGVKG